DVGATFERRRQGQKNDVDLRHTAPLGKTLQICWHSVFDEKNLFFSR
ncbi:MAG: hypothetical protein EZS28_024178, partial [Streblomastix strix]